jgi:hypothetical protein
MFCNPKAALLQNSESPATGKTVLRKPTGWVWDALLCISTIKLASKVTSFHSPKRVAELGSTTCLDPYSQKSSAHQESYCPVAPSPKVVAMALTANPCTQATLKEDLLKTPAQKKSVLNT